MDIKIVNPSEDMNGNQKENIFLALNEEGSYLAHAYVYPFENEHVSYAYPRNIFMTIACRTEHPQTLELKESLLESCISRAKAIKRERWPKDNVRVYTGMPANESDDLGFYLERGFQDNDGTVLMERNLYHFQPRIECTFKRVYSKPLTEMSDKLAFLMRYNEYFTKAMDMEQLEGYLQKPGCTLLQIADEERLLGETLVYEEDGVGRVEIFYVIPEVRGGNAANILMEQTLASFVKKGLTKARLEVWERNKRALYFYSRFGFQLVNGRTELYPGFEM
ncbi:MAG: GNAT family N-acetyltransferase [Clostridia bacterium]|nr:GNAT family N-acetyltransferase [Clostridia bacterium]